MLLFGGMVKVLNSALFTTANPFFFLRNSFFLVNTHLMGAYLGGLKSDVCRNLSMLFLAVVHDDVNDGNSNQYRYVVVVLTVGNHQINVCVFLLRSDRSIFA